MFRQLSNSFRSWTSEVGHFVESEFGVWDPMHYCLMATFTIVIGYVMLSGRR